MPFFSYVGVHEFEKKVGNDFEVNISVETDIRTAAETDDVNHTADYTIMYVMVKEIMDSQVDLIETLVVRIGKVIMDSFPQVTQSTVRINKFNPKVGGPCGQTAVEETFSR